VPPRRRPVHPPPLYPTPPPQRRLLPRPRERRGVRTRPRPRRVRRRRGDGTPLASLPRAVKLIRYIPTSPSGTPQWSMKSASEEGAWRNLENALHTRLRDELRRAGWAVEARKVEIDPHATPARAAGGAARRGPHATPNTTDR